MFWSAPDRLPSRIYIQKTFRFSVRFLVLNPDDLDDPVVNSDKFDRGGVTTLAPGLLRTNGEIY